MFLLYADVGNEWYRNVIWDRVDFSDAAEMQHVFQTLAVTTDSFFFFCGLVAVTVDKRKT